MASTQLLPGIRRAVLKRILDELAQARISIEALLIDAKSAEAVRRLMQQRAEIARVLAVFQALLSKSLNDAAGDAWLAGIESIAAQLGDAVGIAPRISERLLIATEQFMTSKIADITAKAIRAINSALTQHLIGAHSLSYTVTRIQEIMGGEPRWRAMSIAYTEIGRAYSASQYETMLAQAKLLPGLRKRWIHSGKAHARPGHVLAAQQTLKAPIPVEQAFDIVNPRTGEVEQLRYPRDPNSSAFNSVNCGCMMVAVPPPLDELFPASRK